MSRKDVFVLVLILTAVSLFLFYYGIVAFVEDQLQGEKREFRYINDGANEKDDPDISILLDFGEDRFDEQILSSTINIISVSFPQSKQLCIEGVYFVEDSPIYAIPSDELDDFYFDFSERSHAHIFHPYRKKVVGFQGLCSNKTLFVNLYPARPYADPPTIEYVRAVTTPINVPVHIPPLNNLRKYPFDVHYASIAFWAEVVTDTGERIFVAPSINAHFPIGDWKSEVSINSLRAVCSGDCIKGINKATVIDIKLRRPIGIQYLTAMILLTILGLIVSIVIIEDSSNALSVCLAIVLGLWGIQDVLIAPKIIGPTFTRSAIMLLYFLFGIAMLTRFITIPLYRKYRSLGPTNKNHAEYPEERVMQTQEPLEYGKAVSAQHKLIPKDIASDDGLCAPNPSSYRQTGHQEGPRSERKATPDGLEHRLKETTDRQ